MAGPTLSILIEDYSPTTDFQKIYNLIDNLSEERKGKNFYMPASLVSSTSNELMPFSFDIIDINSTESEYDTQELAQIETRTNFNPSTYVLLMAMTNSLESHKLLGKLALRIAEIFNGIIDFGGKLNTNDNIKGTVYNIDYETAEYTRMQYNIGDAEFMKYWLVHENFNLVK